VAKGNNNLRACRAEMTTERVIDTISTIYRSKRRGRDLTLPPISRHRRPFPELLHVSVVAYSKMARILRPKFSHLHPTLYDGKDLHLFHGGRLNFVVPKKLCLLREWSGWLLRLSGMATCIESKDISCIPYRSRHIMMSQRSHSATELHMYEASTASDMWILGPGRWLTER
jgi:hypothetical protein